MGKRRKLRGKQLLMVSGALAGAALFGCGDDGGGPPDAVANLVPPLDTSVPDTGGGDAAGDGAAGDGSAGDGSAGDGAAGDGAAGDGAAGDGAAGDGSAGDAA